MKILANAKDSICNDCGVCGTATPTDHGTVLCSFCLSANLKDSHRNAFKPDWKNDSRNPMRKNWTHHLRRDDDIHPMPR